MKKIVFITCFTLCMVQMYAQKGHVKDAEKSLESGDLKSAAASIELAIDGRDDEKTMESTDTWLIRGKIYQAITNSTTLKNIDNQAVEKAYQSYMNALKYGAIEMEGKKKDHKDKPIIIENLKDVSIKLLEKANLQFEKGKYSEALKLAENRLTISNLPEVGKTDSSAIFFAGLASAKLRKFDEANKYFDKAIEIKYNNAAPFYEKAIIAKVLADNNSYESMLKKGIEQYPDFSGQLTAELITYFDDMNHTQQVINYLEDVKKVNPQSASIIAALGNAYFLIGEQYKAIDLCERAVKIAPNSWETNYYLGSVYYKKACSELMLGDKAVRENKHQEASGYYSTATDTYKRAQSFLEKALTINDKDIDTVKKLQAVYRKTDNWQKATEMKMLFDRLADVKL